jgi:putative transposase
LCFRYGSKLVRITEGYTSNTRAKCGPVYRALGIFLKAMWGANFVNLVGDVALCI